MKNFSMPGVTTALVTPFLENGELNLSMFCRLLERQLDAGIRSLVICGTTGESPTLSDEEKFTLFRTARDFAGSQAILIAGTGSNDTAHAAALGKLAQEAGADGILVVSPYYNKANADGLFAHYSRIAEAVDLPLILYNVPSRTGVDLSPEVCRRLSRIPNVAGIKQASPDLQKAQQIIAGCPRDFSLWSGNDDLTLPMIAIGAQGVISVLSNIYPEAVIAFTQAALAGDLSRSRSLFYKQYPLMQSLFRDINPMPVKAAMELLGYSCGSCRLPLTGVSAEHKMQLQELLSSEPQA